MGMGASWRQTLEAEATNSSRGLTGDVEVWLPMASAA